MKKSRRLLVVRGLEVVARWKEVVERMELGNTMVVEDYRRLEGVVLLEIILECKEKKNMNREK